MQVTTDYAIQRPAGTMGPVPGDASALERALVRVGDRWSLLVVEALLGGPRRFGELSAAVAGIAPNILAARLRRLTEDRLVVATPYSQRPPRLQYELTDDGRELAAALAVLATWAARIEDLPAVRFHDACGTPCELRPYCPTCHRLLDDDDVADLHRL
jgi:DNA-binding HxlR family transcriptional regulator